MIEPNQDMQLAPMLTTTAAICVAIACFLWFLVPSFNQQPFVSVLVHSMSIGLMAASLTTFVTYQLDNHRKTSALWLVGFLIPVSAIAFFFGSMLAKLILGLPLNPFNVFASTHSTISFVTTIIATAIIAGFFISKDQISRLRLRSAQDAQRVESARLAMLQAQIEPHMLFNTLANLRALISADPKRAIDMLDQLDAFLRTTLEGSRNDKNTLSKEFSGVKHYLAIMQIRLAERLTYSLELPDALANIEVPSLLIQPLVENAILHGIEPEVSGGHISVIAHIEKDVLTLEVSDTGVGMKNIEISQPDHRQKGFGLHSLRARLPDINGQASVSIQSPIPAKTYGTQIALRVKV